MGTIKHLDKIMKLFEKSPAVSFSSISLITREKKRKSSYAKQLIRNLISQGKIRKLGKGCYTSSEDPELAVFAFSPAYLGLQDSLSYYDLWEQETIPIIVTTRRVRQGIREVNGTNVLVRRIDKKYLFGYSYFESFGHYLPRSDIEKTLIDLTYYGDRVNEETKKEMNRRIDRKKLEGYLSKYPKSMQKKVKAILDK